MTDLIPRTEKKPAKVKDVGVINLCLAGYGVYSSKSNEVFLLPQGVKELERIASSLQKALSLEALAQVVDCSGSDEAVYSLADRFVREYGSLALCFQERRGRSVRVTGWARNESDAEEKIQQILQVLNRHCKTEEIPFKTIVNIDDSKFGSYCCSPVLGDALMGVDAFACPQCGECYSTHSPVHKTTQVRSLENTPLAQLTAIHTPGMTTIPSLCAHLGVTAQHTLKAMIYMGEIQGQKCPLAVFVRGDHDVSLPKLNRAALTHFSMQNLRRATDAEVLSYLGEVAGYCGPINLPESVYVLTDLSVENVINAVAGANRVDYHYEGCCYGRDFSSPLADLAQWSAGFPCQKCGTPVENGRLRIYAQIQMGHCCGSKALAYRTKDTSETFPFAWGVDIQLESFLLEKFEIFPL